MTRTTGRKVTRRGFFAAIITCFSTALAQRFMPQKYARFRKMDYYFMDLIEVSRHCPKNGLMFYDLRVPGKPLYPPEPINPARIQPINPSPCGYLTFEDGLVVRKNVDRYPWQA